jgi:glycosyltransferase involved in cell wall biosynthesis
LWVVRRRPNKVVRDIFREERQLIHKVLYKTNADVCHANWTYEYAAAAITQKNIPYIITVHDHAWNNIKWNGYKYIGLYLITQWIIRKAPFITAVSPYIAGYVSKIVRRPVPVIPNVISDLIWSLERDLRSNKLYPTIISTLAWSKLKNVKNAIKAFHIARFRRPQARYSLIGPGLENGGPAWFWAVKHCFADGIDFLGPLSYKDTLNHVSQANVLLHPSFEESFGYSVAEAMALKVPVVAAYEAGGVRWLTDNGLCGRLVSGKSPEKMANAIIDTLDNNVYESLKIEEAHKRIKALCNADSVLKNYEKIYHECLASRQRSISSKLGRSFL